MIKQHKQIFIRLQNVRTFFCNFPKAARKARPAVKAKLKVKTQKIDATSYNVIKGTTNNLPYEFAVVRPHVRVMLLQNDIEHEKEVYCAMEIGVGFNDEPEGENYRGLSHLLEHVIALNAEKEACRDVYSCETHERKTFFSYVAPHDEKSSVYNSIASWSKQIFSKSGGATIEDMTFQRERVDNEYYGNHQKRLDRTYEILRMKNDITLTNNFAGNLHTLGCLDDEVKAMAEFEKLRGLYRKRPLNVCIYSNEKIEMDAVLEALNVDDHVTEELRTEAEPINFKDRLKIGKKLETNIIIAQSADTNMQLDIVFPFDRQLNLNESRALKFVAETITYEMEGHLTNFLLGSKYATKCVAFSEDSVFTIRLALTDTGMREIHKVYFAILEYIKFLHDSWDFDGDHEYRKYFDAVSEESLNVSPLHYAYSVLPGLGIIKNEFDEDSLHKTLPDPEHERQLIEEQLLKNKRIRYIVNTWDIGSALAKVKNTTARGATEKAETEPLFGTKFHYFKTDIFAKPTTVKVSFKLAALKVYPDSVFNTNHKICGPVTNAIEYECQDICVTYLKLQMGKIRTYEIESSEKDGFIIFPDGAYYISPTNVEETKTLLKKFKPLKLDFTRFDMYKMHSLNHLTTIMGTSEGLALCLIETAITNLHSSAAMYKLDPIPLRYKTLLKLTGTEYQTYFKDREYEYGVEINRLSFNKKEFNKTFICESMSKAERTTVTYVYFQMDESNNDETTRSALDSLAFSMKRILQTDEHFKNLYNPECVVKLIKPAIGVLAKIVSVETKQDQTAEKILKLVENVVMTQMPHKIKELHQMDDKMGKLLEPMWEIIRKRKLVVQIVGHKSGTDDDKFEPHFSNWFKNHKDKLHHLKDIGS